MLVGSCSHGASPKICSRTFDVRCSALLVTLFGWTTVCSNFWPRQFAIRLLVTEILHVSWCRFTARFISWPWLGRSLHWDFLGTGQTSSGWGIFLKAMLSGRNSSGHFTGDSRGFFAHWGWTASFWSNGLEQDQNWRINASHWHWSHGFWTTRGLGEHKDFHTNERIAENHWEGQWRPPFTYVHSLLYRRWMLSQGKRWSFDFHHRSLHWPF